MQITMPRNGRNRVVGEGVGAVGCGRGVGVEGGGGGGGREGISVMCTTTPRIMEHEDSNAVASYQCTQSG